MTRKKTTDRQHVKFSCDADLLRILDKGKTYSISGVVNQAVREAIEKGYGLDRSEKIATERAIIITVNMDRDLNTWLSSQMSPQYGKSKYINQALRKYLCK